MDEEITMLRCEHRKARKKLPRQDLSTSRLYTASSEEQIAGEFLRKTIERDEHDRRLGEHRRARRDRSPPPPRYSDSTNGRVSSRWRSSRCTKRTASQSYGTSKRAKYSEKKKRDLAVACVTTLAAARSASCIEIEFLSTLQLTRPNSKILRSLVQAWSEVNSRETDRPTHVILENRIKMLYMSKFRDAHVENRATNRRGSLLRLYNQRVLCALFYSVTSLTIA
ncbi:unnamed protein product [Trichogramma brassicae]|uniref:Uncharacterized protein n=1 Tax=Trichogramma brassicae TaxID=86971 RepID=A0A6H5J367_9HYME|nr:unnamed protein product [Trichogramma brassicae]